MYLSAILRSLKRDKREKNVLGHHQTVEHFRKLVEWMQVNINSSKFPISINFTNSLILYPQIHPKITKNLQNVGMSYEIFDCLKHE